MKAVIVDDELRSIEMLEWLLDAYCPEVSVIARFQSPQSALAAIPGLEFDVLFCDIAMPVMNGIELLNALPELPFSVIFVTAHNDIVQKIRSISGGDFLLKPVDDEELSKLLERIRRQQPRLTVEQIAEMRTLLN